MHYLFTLIILETCLISHQTISTRSYNKISHILSLQRKYKDSKNKKARPTLFKQTRAHTVQNDMQKETCKCDHWLGGEEHSIHLPRWFLFALWRVGRRPGVGWNWLWSDLCQVYYAFKWKLYINTICIQKITLTRFSAVLLNERQINQTKKCSRGQQWQHKNNNYIYYDFFFVI